MRSENDKTIVKIIKTNTQQKENLQDYELELQVMRDISANNLKGFPITYDWGIVEQEYAKYFAPTCRAKFIV